MEGGKKTEKKGRDFDMRKRRRNSEYGDLPEWKKEERKETQKQKREKKEKEKKRRKVRRGGEGGVMTGRDRA